jgi:AcrR family transcriptional regulator
MPAALITREEIVDRLFTVFRDLGFDGASMADLSRATGLGKSSLYHYFPDGKIQMAEAVLDRATAVIDTEILGMARAPGSLKTRIQKIIAVLNHMYAGGRTPCVLGQLASSQLGPDGRQGLRTAFSHWIEAIAILAHESGMPPTHAKNFAEDWVASVQGALILQAATADAGAFVRSMDALMALTKKSARGSV